MQACPRRSRPGPSRYRLGGYCWDELEPDLPSEIRRRVTVLLSDLKGSTIPEEAVR